MDSEIKELLLSLKSDHEKLPNACSNDLNKGITNIVVALTIAGLIWVAATVTAIKTEVAILNAELERRRIIIKELEDFTKEDRFTERDFHSKFDPEKRAMELAISWNKQALTSRSKWMDETDMRMNRLENNYNIIMTSINDINKNIKYIKETKGFNELQYGRPK